MCQPCKRRRGASLTLGGEYDWLGANTEQKYEKALKKIGIDLGMLSSEAGHA